MLDLRKSGILRIRKGYAWDGPSGPAIHTKSFMRGSLVHDALYQLIRERKLMLSDRKEADLILRDICIDDGMDRFRVKWVYAAVRRFGESSATPDLITAPEVGLPDLKWPRN
jgi:hypothetical protein